MFCVNIWNSRYRLRKIPINKHANFLLPKFLQYFLVPLYDDNDQGLKLPWVESLIIKRAQQTEMVGVKISLVVAGLPTGQEWTERVGLEPTRSPLIGAHHSAPPPLPLLLLLLCTTVHHHHHCCCAPSLPPQAKVTAALRTSETPSHFVERELRTAMFLFGCNLCSNSGMLF